MSFHIHTQKSGGTPVPGMSSSSLSPSSSSSSATSRVEMIQPSSSSSLSNYVGSVQTSSFRVSSFHSDIQERASPFETRRVESIETPPSDSSGSMQSSVSPLSSEKDAPCLSQDMPENLQDVLDMEDPEDIPSMRDPFIRIVGQENAHQIPRILEKFHELGIHDPIKMQEVLKAFLELLGQKNAHSIPDILRQFHLYGLNDPTKMQEALKEFIPLLGPKNAYLIPEILWEYCVILGIRDRKKTPGILEPSIDTSWQENTRRLLASIRREFREFSIHDLQKIRKILKPFIDMLGQKNTYLLVSILREFRELRVNDLQKMQWTLWEFIDILGQGGACHISQILGDFRELNIVHSFSGMQEILRQLTPLLGQEDADVIPRLLDEFRGKLGIRDLQKIRRILKPFIPLFGAAMADQIPETLRHFKTLGFTMTQALAIVRLTLPGYQSTIGNFNHNLEKISSNPTILSTWETHGFSKTQALSYLLQNVSLEGAISAEHRSVGHILTDVLTELLPPDDTYTKQHLPKEIVNLELEYLYSASPEDSKPIPSSSEQIHLHDLRHLLQRIRLVQLERAILKKRRSVGHILIPLLTERLPREGSYSGKYSPKEISNITLDYLYHVPTPPQEPI